MKVITVFGTRPEAIKLAPVINRLKASSPGIRAVVCVTAQHREMLDQVLKLFDIEPDYDLDIMKEGQSLFDISSRLLERMEDVLAREEPDLVLVQGDTSSTFLASLAAFYMKIPVGHIEAGLRTNNKYSPFPEEINRRLTTHIADLHFAPTERARSNLIAEGIKEDQVFVSGNTAIDAMFAIIDKQKSNERQAALHEYFTHELGLNLANNGSKVVLVTAHRRESFDIGLKNICIALKELARIYVDLQIIYPVHPNPNVKGPICKLLQGISNIHIIDPLEYESFVFLMSKCYMILTDSGGVQEEAPSLGKPTLVMRSTTERPEGIWAGVAKLVGTTTSGIVREARLLLESEKYYNEMARAVDPYGDGRAAERIVRIIKEYRPIKPSG